MQKMFFNIASYASPIITIAVNSIFVVAGTKWLIAIMNIQFVQI